MDYKDLVVINERTFFAEPGFMAYNEIYKTHSPMFYYLRNRPTKYLLRDRTINIKLVCGEVKY